MFTRILEFFLFSFILGCTLAASGCYWDSGSDSSSDSSSGFEYRVRVLKSGKPYSGHTAYLNFVTSCQRRNQPGYVAGGGGVSGAKTSNGNYYKVLDSNGEAQFSGKFLVFGGSCPSPGVTYPAHLVQYITVLIDDGLTEEGGFCARPVPSGGTEQLLVTDIDVDHRDGDVKSYKNGGPLSCTGEYFTSYQ